MCDSGIVVLFFKVYLWEMDTEVFSDKILWWVELNLKYSNTTCQNCVFYDGVGQ